LSEEDIDQRASRYASRRGLRLDRQLGYGRDGIVFSTALPTGDATAVKVFRRAAAYRRELAAYRRLRDNAVVEIEGHDVPELIAHDDELWVIEMTIVTRPYLLDFADAYLEGAPEFPEDVIEEWYKEKVEQFGEARWEKAQSVLATLRGQYAIHLIDITPGNITFGEGEE
jgi:hypothetical protein